MKKILTIVLLFICLATQAQTRLYLGPTAPPFTITPNAGWNVISATVSKRTLITTASRTNSGLTSDNTGAVAPRKIFVQQFTTLPFAAQTLNGTVTGQERFKASSLASGGVMQAFIYLRVINPDGTVASEVGTLTTTNLTTTSTSRTLIALTLSSLALTTGQRLCFEVGGNYSAGTLTTANIQPTFQGDGTADLPVDNTTTNTALNCWVEFSQTLIFQRPEVGFF